MPATRNRYFVAEFAARAVWAMMMSALWPASGLGDPICDPGGSYEPCLGNCPFPTRFDGSGSFSPDGEIVSYQWDFGDGGTDSGVMPEHLYVAFGEFVVTLTVTDDANTTSICTTLARVHCVADAWPHCDIEPSNREVDVGVDVVFDGSGSSGACSEIIMHEWDFGDGSSATGVKVAHRYDSPGMFAVHLTVYDEDYWASTCESWVEVRSPNPVKPLTWGQIKALYR